MPLKTVTATRYVTPLREGGSLPAVMEANDGDLYVTKFIGAAQGPKALIADLVAGEIARRLDLPVPEIVLMQFDAMLGRSEPHQEIQEMMQKSGGLNFGLQYLSGALAYDPLQTPPVSAELASRIVWFDAYVTNVDRTARNVNMLIWQDDLWLIDHGASLYFHHSWDDYLSRSETPFKLIKDHVLLPLATEIETADTLARQKLSEAVLQEIVDLIPAEWLDGGEAFTAQSEFASHADYRQAYVAYLTHRLQHADNFVQEAQDAQAKHL
ncbi:hypothetical protein QUF63_06180 [Anaerolineales bacterium HSG25]|nr:hypothetical protein [Anaerolineales bacterium HSG25]